MARSGPSPMAIRIVRLGAPRTPGEGLRLAPSAPLVSYALADPFTEARWASYARRYRAEMRRPAAARLLTLLAELSKQTDFAVGCYCADESRCHRSLLRALLRAHGAIVG